MCLILWVAIMSTPNLLWLRENVFFSSKAEKGRIQRNQSNSHRTLLKREGRNSPCCVIIWRQTTRNAHCKVYLWFIMLEELPKGRACNKFPPHLYLHKANCRVGRWALPLKFCSIVILSLEVRFTARKLSSSTKQGRRTGSDRQITLSAPLWPPAPHKNWVDERAAGAAASTAPWAPQN